MPADRSTQALDKTYELALAVLILDRLAQPRDGELIRTLALRLIAGQTAAGGWSYTCPVPPSQPQLKFMVALQQTRPSRPGDLYVPGPKGQSLTELYKPAPAPRGGKGSAKGPIRPAAGAAPP